MTYDRPHETPTQPNPTRPDLNLVNLTSDNRNNNANDNRNNNANDNRNYNGNANANDNRNYNGNDNRNNNANDNRNNNANNNRADANSRSDANARSDANSRSNSDSRSNSSATGGTSDARSNATGGNSDAKGGNASVSDNSVNKTTVYGGSAVAPNVYGGGFCSEGGSAGVYVLGIGISGGKTTINESCLKKEDFQRTMTQVCRSADDKSQMAYQGWNLQLQAGRELTNNPMANSVAMSAKRMADAKAKVALELDSVCGTMAATSDATMEAMKRSGLDKPVIIVEEARNDAEQKMLDEALAKKVDELDKRVKTVENKPTAVIQQNNITFIEMDAPKPVHKPPVKHKPPVEKKPADDCVDDKKKK